MRTREIPKYRWSAFLDRFSREHQGCICTLEVESQLAGVEPEASGWPLAGVCLECSQGDARVQVFVGRRLERHLGHSISQPQHVWLEETDEGARTGLRIDADEGAIHLRFRTPQEPAYIETYLP